MAQPAIVFDKVWKKFRKGERHDTLRDLLPSLIRRATSPPPAELKKNEFWALQDVSFAIEPGHALGIIGPNGAGKSTALKVLTRILRPSRGSCMVKGHVGALIEVAAGFHPDLTGRENVYLQGAIMGLGRQEVGRRLDDIVAFSGVGDFIDTPVKRYSSGMNARLGFAIATALDPDVLLIDEVLAVGDLQFQQRCYERLVGYRQGGTAIAFVSHSMQAIASICDKVLLLRPGASPILGTVSEVIPQYLASSSPVDAARARLLEAQLVDAADGPVESRLAPGRPIRINCRVGISVALPRCCWGLRVIRSDGLQVFDIGSPTEGQPPVSLHAGETMEISLGVRLHLGKGLYTLKLELYDEQRHWPTIDLGSVGSVAVETGNRSSDSIAFLDPTFDAPTVVRSAG